MYLVAQKITKKVTVSQAVCLCRQRPDPPPCACSSYLVCCTCLRSLLLQAQIKQELLLAL